MIVRTVAALLFIALALPQTVRADEAITGKVLLQTGKTNTGDTLAYPTGTPEVTTMIIEIAPGTTTPLHRHPVPSIAYMLQGDLEVKAEGGVVNRYKAGDAFAETIGRSHQGTNTGTTPVRILVTYIGVKGEPLTVEAK
ncbi:MAG TPA: cupin domain-containing protein [Alphaproteobacteria bacterium]|jgi:quercetin dioxygenase-like cupin family protein|nr:cupin domain-containing protein [Alphaproteobacteria bacterium]